MKKSKQYQQGYADGFAHARMAIASFFDIKSAQTKNPDHKIIFDSWSEMIRGIKP